MGVSYKEYQKNIGNNKFYKVSGWICLIIGIWIFITDFFPGVKWLTQRNNYTQVYAYSESGTLYYEKQNQRVDIQNIYNSSNEKITLNVPNGKMVMLYIDNNNIGDGIYFNPDNTTDQSIQKPILTVISTLFLVAVGLYFIITSKEAKEDKATTKPVFWIYIFLFTVGAMLIIVQVYSITNYLRLEKQNNITIATICSEIYSSKERENRYRPVAEYYVNGNKYLYIDNYKDGTLEAELGNTIELYYDEQEPNKTSQTKNPVDAMFWICGIALMLIATPGLFFRKKFEKHIQESASQAEKEWKI